MHICPNNNLIFTRDKLKACQEQSFQNKLHTSKSGRKIKALKNSKNGLVTIVKLTGCDILIWTLGRMNIHMYDPSYLRSYIIHELFGVLYIAHGIKKK